MAVSAYEAEFARRLQIKLKEFPEEQRETIAREFMKTWLTSSVGNLAWYLEYNEVDPRVHGEIIASLEDSKRRKIICVPRGTFKSSLAAVVYPIWRLLKNPSLRILIDSELYMNSTTYLRAIKGHLESEKMTKIFGPFKNNTLWREDGILINQRQKNFKEPSITVGGVGTTKVGQHYDLIIGDDYNSPSNTSTKEQADKVVQHYRYNLNILEPEGEYIIIGTRYGENDLIGWVLREILGESKLAEGKF